jgi:hypothetical protein
MYCNSGSKPHVMSENLALTASAVATLSSALQHRKFTKKRRRRKETGNNGGKDGRKLYQLSSISWRK